MKDLLRRKVAPHVCFITSSVHFLRSQAKTQCEVVERGNRDGQFLTFHLEINSAHSDGVMGMWKTEIREREGREGREGVVEHHQSCAKPH